MPGNNASPKWLLDMFEALVPHGAQSRKMFGHPAMWVNGHMFVMLVDKELGVRISDKDKVALSAVQGTAPFEPRGRCNFHGMVQLPVSKLKDETFVKEWVQRAFGFAKTLPPKKPSDRKK